jgi:3-hydroxy-9,10-secoandrosta-1,3,5(10)-triene-9,17-dione monooxygenase reductase component
VTGTSMTGSSTTDRVGAIDGTTFRAILGRFTTGVVVVCATVDDRPVGMSVNSFTSVSLAPPLVAFCAAHTSATWAELQQADAFAVSILAGHQQETCSQLARKGIDRFAGVDIERAPSGAPVIAGSLAWLDCTMAARHEAGDHDIVGEVHDLHLASEADPLVFFGSRFVAVQR